MFVFCFNDCIPQDYSDEIADRCLANSLREYNKLTKQFPEETDGIITSYTSSYIPINRNSSLYDCIGRITDHGLKRYAFSIFLKFPVESYYIIDEAELVEKNLSIYIGEDSYNAIYPFVVFRNQGVLFSLAVHSDICKNQIPIFVDGRPVAKVDNLFGLPVNTEYIAGIIQQTIYNNANNFDKLLRIIGNAKVSERFQKKFERFPTNIQQSIIDHFIKAKQRNLPTRFSADNNLIKDVTPEKETKVRVFELRIFDPIACRVYFHETAEYVYLGSAENKPSKKTQDNHIITARNIIKELIAL